MPPAVSRVDAAVAGAANSASRQASCDAALAEDISGRLQAFRDLAHASALSTNVDAVKMLTFDEAREVLDARAVEVHRAGGDMAAGLAAFAARQLKGRRREAFEALWIDGERFIYGALNAGGLGTRGRFGHFCLVLSAPSTRGRTVALFPGDSAQRYTDDMGSVDAVLAGSEISTWNDRAALAVVERGTEAMAAPADDWPGVVCRPDHYLEAVLSPPLPLADVAEVRVAKTYADRLADLQVRELAGDDLPGSERQEARAYSALQGWRSALGTRLEELT